MKRKYNIPLKRFGKFLWMVTPIRLNKKIYGRDLPEKFIKSDRELLKYKIHEQPFRWVRNRKEEKIKRRR